MVAITDRKGFHITSPSGITLSTQFGGGNYCTNHNIEIGSEPQIGKLQSRDAEIAIWNKEGIWVTQRAFKEKFSEEICDDVEGYVELEKWLKIVDWCKSYKSEEKRKEASEE